MKETLKLTISLGVICAAAALVLAVAHQATQPAQEEAALKEQQGSLKLVLPNFDNNPLEQATTVTTKDERKVTFYPALKDGVLVAFAAEGSTEKGYGGKLTVLAGLKPDGTIRAVVVSDHAETPGLGTQVTDRKRDAHISEVFRGKRENAQEDALPPSAYLDQYTDRSVTDGHTFAITPDGGDIEPVSGATISSRAVADAVNAIADAFRENQAKLQAAAR